MNNLIGQHLGPYRILEQIGTGGMAAVYKAYQPAMDRHVAVKVIAPHFAREQMFLKRFRREARAVARLEHAHILPVYDSGEAEGRPYLVMRYLEAGTLKDRMAEGPLPLREVNRIVGQVASALDYAHRMGVIHRDVKPTNVLLDAEGDAFLTDFGLAKMMEASVQLTETGVGVGTPAYMSPEQGQGAKVDSRADVYSLGVILYEMVTGRTPYEAETPLAVVLKHITEPLPLPRSVRPDLPEEVERVILRALAKEPDGRFQTAGEMGRVLDAAVRALDAAARTEPGARVEPAVAKAAEGFLARAVTRVRETTQAGWARTAMWMAAGAVALLILFLVLSRIPLRVRINDDQVELVRVVEETATPEVALVTTPTEVVVAVTMTPTSRPVATPTPRSTPIPTRTPVPTEAPSEEANFRSVALNALAVDPNDPDTIFAGTYGAGIYVSRDGGQTWAPSNEGLGKGTVGSIVVDSNDSKVVYAALFDQGGVYKSTDGGRTWTAANRGINLDDAWNWTGLVYLDPTDSSRLYYSGTSNGLYHFSDGGATWTYQISEDSPAPAVLDLVIDPGDGEHLCAGAERDLVATGPAGAGVYESHNGGRTWKRLTTEEMVAPGGDAWHLAADPKDFSTLYASGKRGTYKTSDGGQSWTPILDQGCDWLAASEVALYCGKGGDMLISPDGGQSWEKVLYDAGGGRSESRPFAIVPGDPQTLYAGFNVLIKSTDGGSTWTRVGGLGVAARMRVTVDPRDSNRLFLSGVDHVSEVFRSEDGGRTWQVITTHGGWRSRVAIDSAQDIVYVPSGSDGLYRSRDNGQTWERFGSGYVTGGPRQLVPDPLDAKRLWLVSMCGARLALSEDGGETFAMVESFPQDVCEPILLVHQDGQRMYVVAWEGFYRSDDGGETWSSLGGLGGIYHAAALDPSNPDVVYVGSTHKGVLETTDGGHSWRQVNSGLTNPSINELAIDPANPQTVYAATDGGAFVSVDGGENWLPIQEELGPNPIVYSIAVDPNDPSQVYAATPDGVFRLEGAPSEVAATTPTSSLAAQEHADRAAEYVARAHWDEAIAEISRAIELDPTNPQYYITRAFLYDAGKGMMEEAVADATKAIELAPTLYVAWTERGAVYMHMQECALAVADHNEAISLDPDRFDGYTHRADALRCQDKLDAAIADYDRAIAIDPTSAWTFWNRAMIYEQKGELGAAIADYDQAITLEPDDPWASLGYYYSRAGAHRALDQHEQALTDCDAALTLVPDDPQGFYCRGLSEVALGQMDKARADFEQAVSLTPISAWSAGVTAAAQAELDKMGP